MSDLLTFKNDVRDFPLPKIMTYLQQHIASFSIWAVQKSEISLPQIIQSNIPFKEKIELNFVIQSIYEDI